METFMLCKAVIELFEAETLLGPTQAVLIPGTYLRLPG
jgi:hypothetical protein